MLILTRKEGEEIKLSNGVVFRVLGIHKGLIRVGIEAPLSIGIKRSIPCCMCNNPCYTYYLGHKDIPFCNSERCNELIKKIEDTKRGT